MSRRTVIARKLILIAGRILVSSIDSDFENALRKSRRIGGKDLSDTQIECLIERMKKTSQPKMKGFLKWLFEKGIVELPKDRSGFMEFGKDFEVACDALGKEVAFDYQTMKKEEDFLKLVHPEDYPDDSRCVGILRKRYLKEVKRRGFNPEVSFGHGKRVSDDTVFYDLKDTNETMREVRQALDFAYDLNCNPWCLITRNYKEPDFSEGSRNNEKAWYYWNYYSSCPKRIAFSNGRPMAFYADWKWWDLDDISHDEYPYGDGTEDEGYLENHLAEMNVSDKIDLAETSDRDHLLFLLSEDDDFKVRMTVFKNENADDGIREHIIDNETDPDNALEILEYADEKMSDDGRSFLDDDMIRNVVVRINDAGLKKMASEAGWEDVLSCIAEESDNDEVLKLVAENENTGVYTLDDLIESSNADVRLAAAGNENIDSDALDEMVEDEDDEDVLAEIAKNKYVSQDTFFELFDRGLEKVNRNLAKNDRVPDEILSGLFSRGGYDKELSSNGSLPVKDALALIESSDDGMKAEIASRSYFDKVLYRLAEEDSIEIARNVARNRHAGDDVLLHLYEKHGDGEIQLCIDIVHNSRSDRVLSELADHPSEKVRDAVFNRADRFSEVINHVCSIREISMKISYGQYDDGQIRELAQCKYDSVLNSIARYGNTPDDVLYRLLERNDDGINSALLDRKNIPEGVLMKLVSEGSEPILLKMLERKDLTDSMISKLFDNDSLEVKGKILRMENFPDAIKTRAMKDPDMNVRRLLIRSYTSRYVNIPDDVIDSMLSDSSNESDILKYLKDYKENMEIFRRRHGVR